MTLIVCQMPQCQTARGCICERNLRPIRLPMCRMAAAFVRLAGETSEPSKPNAMVCSEQPCTYPHCRIGGQP